MGRRAIKEYRAAEALQLILADRDRERLACPSCGHPAIERTPGRSVTLRISRMIDGFMRAVRRAGFQRLIPCPSSLGIASLNAAR